MKTIALLEIDEAREVLERLKKESIPTEVQTTTQESGLEISEIKVRDDYYDRGCDVVEAWNTQQIIEAKKGRRLGTSDAVNDSVSPEVLVQNARKRVVIAALKVGGFGLGFVATVAYCVLTGPSAFAARFAVRGKYAGSGAVQPVVLLLLFTGLATVVLTFDLRDALREYRKARHDREGRQ
jgi:hypothetical protein